MKCTSITQRVDDYLDGNLNALEHAAFERHVMACNACATRVDDARLIDQALHSLPIVEPSADFEQRMFAEVRRQHATRQPHKPRFIIFGAGFATAAVAGLAIWLTTTLFVEPPLLEQPQVIALAMHQTQTVRLMFDAHKDIEQVSLSIDLPDNMQLAGYADQRELSWTTRLHKGQNVLELPIQAIAQGQGKLVARLNYGDRQQSISLLLKTTINGVQHFEIKAPHSA